MRRLLLLVLLGALVVPVAAPAAEPSFTMDEISRELMCPTCGTRLDLSHAPAADAIRRFIERRRAQGQTREQVKAALVAEFGPAVLASPPRDGFGLVAWVVPAAVALVGVAVAAGLVVAWRRRSAEEDGGPDAPALDPDGERRVDEALARFDGA